MDIKILRLAVLLGGLFLEKNMASAQESWTLERAIKYAQETNLGIKQAKAGIDLAENTLDLNRKARLPNLSANLGQGLSSGRFFEQSTGQVVTSTAKYNNYSLSSGLPLYQGGAIKNSIEQSKYDLQAAQADADEAVNNLALTVAQAYLQILLSEEQLEIAKKQQLQSEEQLKRTDKLIAVGTLAQNERLNLVAQIARNEGAVVAAQNSVDLSYLNLKNILQLEPDRELKIVRPSVIVPDVNPEVFQLKTIYAGALGTQPQIRAGEIREKSAYSGEKIARAGYLPTISVFGDVSTRWSSQIRDVIYSADKREGPPIDIVLNGQPLSFSIVDNQVDDIVRVPYFEQLDRNLGVGAGLQTQIPILQNGRTKANVQRAKLNLIQTQIRNEQTRNTLKNNIQTAIANSKAARKTYETNVKTVNAFRTAFENTQKRFDLGAVNALDLTTAKTTLDNAESELLISKYDYVLKLKVIDFYQGRKLSLD